jgi:dimethyl sulfone monooxygenase SfnG
MASLPFLNGHSDPTPALNSDPDRIKFAYWVPNVSGGLVISKIPQRTNWDLASNVKYAQTAEKVGFEYALSQIRFMAGYGAEHQHEPVSFSQAILHQTDKLILIAALLPGPWNPAVAAKQIASIDHYSQGRIAVNIVSGWFKTEFTSIGQWWLDHAERYRRSREFIECLRGIWTQEKFTFKGDFYQFHDYPLSPKPLKWEGRPHPEIFQGGNSIDARENAATVSDYYFMNGNSESTLSHRSVFNAHSGDTWSLQLSKDSRARLRMLKSERRVKAVKPK